MKKQKAILSVLLGTAAAAATAFAGCITASAGSVDDVLNAMREIGIPESIVLNARTRYETVPHDENGMTLIHNGRETYDTYENWADYVTIFGKDYIYKGIAAELGIPAEDVETFFASSTAPAQTDQEGGGGSVTTVTTPEYVPSVVTDKPFRSMTLEEKKAYVASLPAEERMPFLASLSPSERNSIIKQLDTDSKSDIVSGFADLASDMGMNVSVDHIEGNDISLSIRDDEGKLIDTAAVGASTVDDTGWDLRLPVLGSLGAMALAVTGLGWIALRESRQEADANG